MVDRIAEDALPLPLTVEAIDIDWLTRALGQQLPHISVTDARVEDVMLGTSTKIRVRIKTVGEGADQLPDTLIVKGGFEEHSPKMAAMYANEARFYSDIQPFVPMPSPRCFFAGSDRSSHQSIVIMEDLRRPGVTFCDGLKPQTYDQIARRIETMAAYHAATWESPLFEPGGRWADIHSRFETWGLEYMRRYLIADVWAHYMASPRGAAVSTRLHDREWMERALINIGEVQHRQPKCLIHGDTHLGNLYIMEDGTPGYFDAQVARTAWHHEVSYHIVCAADLADRAAWERPLLDHYLLALERAGGPLLDRNQAWHDYRCSIVWGLFIFLTNEVRFQTETVNTAYAARFGQAALDHDLPALIR
ncbi:phosphotransferase family protein [Sphingobium yanoikuyae]|uniref:Uncharacterized protein n=1 Tax=Sphingobium yanoikuyae TaxID=13690 RepID=A0A291N021_SPHYA|nr:phosphotransferase [Sphingobium yanoikuyae]ATI80689.1 hypothetical protein A6768_12285 [Sphingobium yanoikuyae]